ncbi:MULTISPECIES: MCE family protein [unclassified Rhodococcus (in: high G+C Gram-positive bacteria)]|uniref:MCE family protein n=1 Tax=Rhodococcus sp. SJ-3 TaxID=3454628 RepID=UPI003F7A8491
MNPTAKTWLIRGVAIVAVLALCAAGVWYVVGPDRTRTVTAQFATVSGIYPGSNVAVLGLPVGTVEEVRPAGTYVEVTMSVPSDIALPENVTAFVMNPSVISDRFVELAPAYRGGAQLGDDGVIPVERSHSPINWDEMLESVDTLAAAMGPEGGDLGRTLEVSADATEGLGEQMNRAIVALGQATSVVGAKSEDIGGLIDDLGAAVRAVNSREGSLTELVDGVAELGEELQRQNLDVSAPISQLSTILDQLDTLLAERGGDVEQVMANARVLTDTFAANEVGLAELFDVLPLAMQNIDQAIGENGRGRIRLNISTQISQFPRAQELCARERLPLCTGAGFTNPLTVPFDLSDPYEDLVPESLDRALGEGGPR